MVTCQTGDILNRGTLVMARSRVTNNGGSGIVTESNASVDTSTVSSNSGTGIRITSGEAYIRDSTIDDNASSSGAGGIEIDAGAAMPVLARSTIGTTSLRGTILAANTNGGTARSDCGGSIASGGYNLVGTTAHPGSPPCSFTAVSTDLVGTSTPIDPMLKVLGSYGGKTRTMVPRPTSPAVNVIPVGAPGVLCTSGSTDQRGIMRPQGGACDIGSVERKPKE